MAPSLVIELQQQAQSGSSDVSELLRRAKVVASKLRLDDFDEWFEHELSGYPKDADVPDYRVVRSRLMMKNPYHGLQPVFFRGNVRKGQTSLAEHFASVKVRESIGRVAFLSCSKEGQLECAISDGEMKALLAGSEELRLIPPVRLLDVAGFAAILDAVRNRILKWSLDLERRGILGADMTFTKEEQVTASRITINNYGSVGSVVQGASATATTVQDSPGSVVTVATGSATIHERLKMAIEATSKLDVAAATAIERLANGVAILPENTRTAATEALTAIAEQCAVPEERRLPRSVLTSVVLKLRETLSLSADVLQVWTTFGPAIVGWLGVILK